MPETDTLTPALQRQITALRRPFSAFVERFHGLTQSRAQLAPQFMRVYGAYQAAGGGTFVTFIRTLDPSLPMETAAYKATTAYQAADYLRRLVARRSTGEGNRAPAAPATRSNLTALARTLATILPLVRDAAIVWRAVEQEFGFTARQVTRLQQVVSATQPLLTLPGVHPSTPRIVHMEVPVNPVAATQPSAQQGRRGGTVARKRAA